MCFLTWKESATPAGRLLFQLAVSMPDTDETESGLWPTPRANKVHPEITEQNRDQLAERDKANLEEVIAGKCGEQTGSLNPQWVEWLMGYPVGWTDLKDSETPSSRKSPTKSLKQSET
jgi:hypothetical protein